MFPFAQTHDNLEQRRRLQKQRLHHRLQLQSRQIERVMDAHQLPAQVSGGRVAPQAIQFDLQTQLQGGWEWVRSLTDDLRQALGVPHISLTRENGRLQVAVARPAHVPVRLLDVLAMAAEVERETAVIGLSDGGSPVFLPLHDHVLISGVSGAGKTSLLRSISMSLALTNRQSQLQQIIIAPILEQNNAYAELKPLTLLPHMTAHIAFRVDEASQLLAWLVSEMDNRLRWRETTPAIVLMIDQVVALMDFGEPLSEPITELLQKGGQAGIHLILTTSWPESDLLDTFIKSNLPQRIVGQAADSDQAVAASGLESSEAEYLLGHGDFLLVQSDREPLYFQGAYIGDYDLHMSLKKLHRQGKVSILAQPFSIRPELSEQDLEPIPASFWMRNGAAHFFDEEE